MTDMNANEFADFWESHEQEKQLGIDWMAKQMATDAGKDLISEAASILATRHGISSDPVKGFRSAMRKASEKAGISPPLTIKKVKGEKQKMCVAGSKPHSTAAKKRGEDIVYDHLKKLIESEKCTVEEMQEGVEKLIADLS